MSRTRRALAAGLVLAAAVASALPATADGPARLVVGKPRGFAPGAASGAWAAELPSGDATERWRRDLGGVFEVPPLVDAAGNIIVVFVAGQIAKVGAGGQVVWRRRICPPSKVPPVLASDGATVILCSDGTAVRVSASGVAGAPTELNAVARDVSTAPLARDDGSVFFATDHELIHLGAAGEVLARASLPARERTSGRLLPFRRGIIATGRGGELWYWQPPQEPRSLGSFGGPTDRGAVVLGPRAIAAVVGRERLAVLDPVSRQVTSVSNGAGLDSYEGPPARTPGGELLLTTVSGELVAIDDAGDEVRRVPLEGLGIFGTSAGALLMPASSAAELRSSPPLLVDRAGAVAFVRQSGLLGVVRDDGAALLEAAVCPRPVGLVSAGPGRMVVACQSGTLVMWGAP